MAEVEVRRAPDGTTEHRHDGYDGWHPVNQKHKNHLHENLGITGRERQNRRSPSSIGVYSDSQKKPDSKPKVVGTGSKPQWRWDDSMTVRDYLTQYANARPRSKSGRVLCTAVNATGWLYRMFRRKLDEKSAQASEQGFEDALKAFDERFKFHGTDDFDRLTVDDIRLIDKDLTQMARQKYKEYGGASLKGKKDPESLRRKAEIRTYVELTRKLRERAEAEARENMSRRSADSTREPERERPMSARDIRERNRRNRI